MLLSRRAAELTHLVTIGEIATLINGYAFPIVLQGQEGVVPFYKVGDMNSCGNEVEMGNSNNYVSLDVVRNQRWNIAPKGTVIFPKIGAAIATNKKRILSRPAIFDNNIMGLICGDRILPKFMWYILNSIDISQWATLANPPSILRDVVLEQKIPLPSLIVQRQIVSELDRYQQIILGAQEVVDNYRPLFSIDASWPVKELGDICTFEYGYTSVARDRGDTRYIRITDINADGSLSNEDNKFVNLTQENQKYLLSEGDILVARIGATYGKTFLFEGNFNAVFASYLIRLKFDKYVLPKYYFYFAQSHYYWEQARNLVTGAGQPQFNANAIKHLQVPLPSIDEQQHIISEIETEAALVEPSKMLINIFREKIKKKIKKTWGE